MASAAYAMDMNKLGMGHGQKMGENKAPARKADIPLIKCQVCELYVKQAIKATKELRAAVKPGHKVTYFCVRNFP